MTTAETKKWVIESMKAITKSMKAFEGDTNPQIREMYMQEKGKFDILDDLYFKLFHKYYKE